MTRTMGDSSTFGDVPKTFDIIAAYINGHEGVATKAEMDEKYPASTFGHVLIDVTGRNPEAQVRDWETGDKSGSLEQWVIDHNKNSGTNDAVVYCNKSTIEEVRLLTGSQVLATDYFLWVATLDDTVYGAPGVIACQNKGATQTGGHWDSSLVYNDRFWQPAAIVVQTPVVTKPDCTGIQNAVHADPDNIWGQDTDKRCTTVISASNLHFPHGVGYAQSVVGAKMDNIWGPQSKIMLRGAVTNIQTALLAMRFSPGDVDGIWGVHTAAAYSQARTACQA